MNIPESFETRRSRTESYIKKNFPEFYQYLLEHFEADTFAEKLYKYINVITDSPKCAHCGKTLKFISYSRGYGKYCCALCANSDKEKLNRQKETFKEKYGDNSVVRDKMAQTMIERYGENYNELILNKRKQTCLKKYGVEFPLSSKEVRQKVNETVSKRTDEQKSIIIKKAKQTKLERYGDENYNNSEKAKQTFLQKYGVEYPFQSQEIQNKGRQTRLEKYGSIYPLQNKKLCDKSRRVRKQNYISKSNIILDRIGDKNLFICKCTHPDTCNKCIDKTFEISYDKFFVRSYDGRELCTKLCRGDTNKDTTIELFIKDVLNN